jgi:hypothetical protein
MSFRESDLGHDIIFCNEPILRMHVYLETTNKIDEGSIHFRCTKNMFPFSNFQKCFFYEAPTKTVFQNLKIPMYKNNRPLYKQRSPKEITSSTHTPATVLKDSLVARACEYLLPYLLGNGARKELDVYEHFYSCRQCWASKCRGL